MNKGGGAGGPPPFFFEVEDCFLFPLVCCDTLILLLLSVVGGAEPTDKWAQYNKVAASWGSFWPSLCICPGRVRMEMVAMPAIPGTS